MNKQEILEEINKTKEHLANMEKMLEKCEYERWKPKENEEYYLIDMFNEVFVDRVTGITMEEKLYKVYNCFQTREQAEAEAEKILVRRLLEDIARRLNKGKETNWNSSDESKYYIYLEASEDILSFDRSIRNKIQGVVYCTNMNFLDVAIREIGEERLKKYLRGE